MSVRSGRAVLALPAAPTSAGVARTFVRSRLGELAVPDPPLADAVLLTSELVTNVLLHAGTDLEVRLTTDPGQIRVEVHDRDSRPPHRFIAGPEATSGRGLLLVQELAGAWGVEPAAGGKAVWFEMVIDAVV